MASAVVATALVVGMGGADGAILGVAVATTVIVAGALVVTGAAMLQAAKLNEIVDKIHFM